MTNLDRCQVSKWYLWRTGKPGIRQSMGLQRVRHDWVTEQQQQQQHMKETVGGKTRSLIETAKLSLWNWTFSVTTLSCKFISTEDKSICYPNWNMLFKWFDDLFYHDVYFFPHTCKQFSNTSWVCYNLVHNNTIYLKQLQIPEVKGLVPQTCHPPHFRSLSQIHLTMHFWSNH